MAEGERQSADDENDSRTRVDRPDILIQLENEAHGVLCSSQICIVYTNDLVKKELNIFRKELRGDEQYS
jgi:hypothetical protein